jgi:hypothetical protein
MKKIYFIVVTLFFVILILEHDNMGVAYNPLFHIEGGDSDNSNIYAMWSRWQS